MGGEARLQGCHLGRPQGCCGPRLQSGAFRGGFDQHLYSKLEGSVEPSSVTELLACAPTPWGSLSSEQENETDSPSDLWEGLCFGDVIPQLAPRGQDICFQRGECFPQGILHRL